MKTLNTIENLKSQVQLANTADVKQRQLIANASKKLYILIEENLYNKYGQQAIDDAYNNLCNGDFAEPFHCEKQKEKFNLFASIATKLF